MSIINKIIVFNDLAQAAFKNSLDTAEKLHQASAEIPLEVLKELGYPDDRVEAISDSHRRILRVLYGSISSGCEDLGKLVALQAYDLSKLAGNFMGAGDRKATADKETNKETNKTRARKVSKKKASRKKSPARATKSSAGAATKKPARKAPGNKKPGSISQE
jgi:hypothetical protein